MKTVNNVDELVLKGYKSFRLVDAQDYEVIKYRKTYPTLNFWSTKADEITDDALYHGEGCNIATLLPPRIHLYADLVDRNTVYVCMELTGGL